jgi:probable rRNA maturation factor
MPDSPSSVIFRHPSRRVQRRELRQFVTNIAANVGGGRGITCLVTTDRELRSLNRAFRGKDYATDVLSFPPTSPNGALGEIAISFDRAAEQAAQLGHPVEDELRILILHGALHLIGMDHEKDSGQMRRAETRWRKRLGLPSGLIERSR